MIDERLSRDEALGLVACSLCHVSLHRGEGFGLPIAEAMVLGKPAIATAYSGNVDFTNEANAYLVQFDLTELQEDFSVHPKGAAWAEPRMDEAVAQMWSVSFDEAGRKRTARVAQEFIGRRYARRVGGDVIRGRMEDFVTLSE